RELAKGAFAERCRGARHELTRLALSSFSAGFAAVQQLLRRDQVATRIDAVLLSDSLYGAYRDVATKEISQGGFEPFLNFARAAVREEKLMAVTHSQVRTEMYASTREMADELLAQLSIDRRPATPGSLAFAGDFWLRGLPGHDARAHSKHLQQMGNTVF